FPLVVAFYPISALVVFVAISRPRAVPALVVTTAAGAALGAASFRRPRPGVAAVAALAPAGGAGVGAGLRRGLAAEGAEPGGGGSDEPRYRAKWTEVPRHGGRWVRRVAHRRPTRRCWRGRPCARRLLDRNAREPPGCTDGRDRRGERR